MTNIVHFEAFLLASILLNLTPGNDTLFILSKSIGQGKQAGLISALGIGTGSLIHTLLAAFGLSVIIAKSLLLFNIIKYTGATYLVYTGIGMLRNPAPFNAQLTPEGSATAQHWRIYRDAVITNVLNPKVALFFIAFLPQFIDPLAKQTTVPFLLLGLSFIVTGTSWCFCLALFASALFGRLKANPGVSVWINRLCGGTLVGLGVRVALSERNT